jgi:recombination protein RecT
MTNTPVTIKNDTDLKVFLHKNYMSQIKNFFGDEKQAMKFLSSVMADVQRNPKLLECTPMSVINSYITMAQLGFMPSNVSGESYVLPYDNNKQIDGKWVKVKEAQFQIGYKGLVTLYYQAGVQKFVSALVRKNDKATFINGEITHEIDMNLSQAERGDVVGAYVTAIYNDKPMTKYMNIKDIIAHGARFSKSYDPTGKYSPWNPANDPEGWMYMKTVLKQHKLLPKNKLIDKALAEDNKDSIMSDRLETAKKDSESLNMGAALKLDDGDQGESVEEETIVVEPVVQEPPMPSTPVVEIAKDLPPEEENESPHKKAMRQGMKKAEAEKDPNQF